MMNIAGAYDFLPELNQGEQSQNEFMPAHAQFFRHRAAGLLDGGFLGPVIADADAAKDAASSDNNYASSDGVRDPGSGRDLSRLPGLS